ncbi:MAG: hypothetical protein AAGG01_12060, partial [Planctomycetota bacterium]
MRSFFFLPLLVAGLLTYVLFADLGASAFLGFDAYPLIAASRFESLVELGDSLTVPLMGYRYPDGDFYRPLVHLSFAFDDWRSGQSLDPSAFHLSDLVIAFACAALLGALAFRITAAMRTDPRADDSRAPELCAAITAIVAYLLHRAQLDAVPYAPRRADTLCVTLVAASVLAAYAGKRTGLVALLATLSFFSKETGVIAVPLVAIAAWIRESSAQENREPGEPNPKILFKHTVLWTAGAMAVAIGIRTAVLQGIGGHAESGTAETATRGLDIVWNVVELWSSGVPAGATIPVSLVVLVAGNLFLHGGAARRALALAGAWALLVLGITAFSGRAHAWYVVPLLAPIAVAAGSAVGAAFIGKRGPGRAGAASAILLVGLLGRYAVNAPQHAALRVAEPIAADQVQRFMKLVEEIQPGERRRFEPHVIGVVASPETPPVFLHADYSFHALVELGAPDK